ncbi:MAG: efflux RND transporter periplasmic adaptor subunit [Dysgonamonadaceae bacterium]|jgi:RND family efflux transporter MFP subunit|nr:efflux RND transporter periplasmic adaptor subunit [Dysgonamonadaceae bacterium]
MKKIFFAMLISGIAFYGCKHNHDESDHADRDSDKDVPEGSIHFHTKQQEKIKFTAELPVVEPFGQVIKTTAQVLSAPEDEAVISARMSGIILFSGNNLSEGQTVNAGQALFTISGANLADNNSQVRFTEALNNYKKAESDYQRAKDLKNVQIVSEKDFLQIQADYEKAKAIYNTIYQNFSGKGQTISAPFQSFIKQVFVENGQFVEEGQALATVSKNKTLLLRADVRTKHATLLPYLFSASVVSSDKSEVYDLAELNGKIMSFGKSIDPESYRIPVSIRIDNKAGFISGGFVEVYLKTRSENPVMTIPISALIEEQGIYFVYVQSDPEHFEKREVTIGANDGIRTEILSGLNKEEKVVTQGAISLKLAQSAGALDPHAGHAH